MITFIINNIIVEAVFSGGGNKQQRSTMRRRRRKIVVSHQIPPIPLILLLLCSLGAIFVLSRATEAAAATLLPYSSNQQHHRADARRPVGRPAAAANGEHTAITEVRATKGQFWVHMLHAANYFPQTVDVKWTVSLRGRPELPQWLHLVLSRHKPIAYLVGTPVTQLSEVTVHVIARRVDNFQASERFITILLQDDARFHSPTKQIVELRLTGVDIEELLYGRTDKIEQLERAIQSTFRGRNVNTYIFTVIPESEQYQRDYYSVAKHSKIGTIIQVGTQSQFHSNVHEIARGLQLNSKYCVDNKVIPMDKHFRPYFHLDWCRFFVPDNYSPTGNFTTTKGGVEDPPLVNRSESARIHREMEEQNRKPPPPVYYIWESVVLFPILAVVCLCFLIALSVIFFGRREGQQWRDYKTPKEQLQQYMNIRESQKHLRELAIQRQLHLMCEDEGLDPPVTINTFLQPRYGQPPAVGGDVVALQPSFGNGQPPQQQPTVAPNGGSLLRGGGPRQQQKRPSLSRGQWQHNSVASLNRGSIGKHTVAEAARASGSSLNLYRSPPTIESEEEEEEGEEDTEEKELPGYFRRRHRRRE